MSAFNANSPAYPRKEQGQTPGLTKLELLAGMAMQGLLASDGPLCKSGTDASVIAAMAVDQAKALLSELEKAGKGGGE